mgnify:CR=1 FL=1
MRKAEREKESKLRKNTCGLCSKDFSQNQNMEYHVATVHEGKKPFKCDIVINETMHEREEENSSIQSDSQAGPSSSINISELTFQKAAQNGIETQLPKVQGENETHDQSNDVDLETNINLNVENANNKKRPAKKEASQEETTKKPSSKRKKGDFMCEMCIDTRYPNKMCINSSLYLYIKSSY